MDVAWILGRRIQRTVNAFLGIQAHVAVDIGPIGAAGGNHTHTEGRKTSLRIIRCTGVAAAGNKYALADARHINLTSCIHAQRT